MSAQETIVTSGLIILNVFKCQFCCWLRASLGRNCFKTFARGLRWQMVASSSTSEKQKVKKTGVKHLKSSKYNYQNNITLMCYKIDIMYKILAISSLIL